jgi:hypothetical protein
MVHPALRGNDSNPSPQKKTADPAPQPAPKHIVPIIILVIVMGISAPFFVASYRGGQIENNQNEVIQLLRDYVKAQNKHFTEKHEYARTLADLGEPFSKMPEISETPGAPEYKGYRFRMLLGESGASGSKSYMDESGKMTAGHGLLAAPAKYGYTGKNTFLISGEKIYFIDLDVKTDQTVVGLNHFTVLPGAARIKN